MTDTGQIPGEGQPENAGMVEQPGVLAPDAYTYLDPSEQAPYEDDVLLMPAAQGGWSDPQIVPPPAADAYQQFPSQSAHQAQEPLTAQENPAQGTAGHDSGAYDLGAVRIPAPAPVPAAAHAMASAPSRRPLHRGPSVDGPSYGGQSGLVRSLADRGPAGSPQPARPVAPAPVAPEYPAQAETPVPAEIPAQAEVPAPTEIPAQAEVPAQAEAPVAQAEPVQAEPAQAEVPAVREPVLPGPQLGEIPLQGAAPWGAPEPVTAAEQPGADPHGAGGTLPSEPAEAVRTEIVPEAVRTETVPEAAPAEADQTPAPADFVPAQALPQPAPGFEPAAAPGFEPAAPAQEFAPDHAVTQAPTEPAPDVPTASPAETVVPDAPAEALAPAPVFAPEATQEPYFPVEGTVPATEFAAPLAPERVRTPEQVQAPAEPPAPEAQAAVAEPRVEEPTTEPVQVSGPAAVPDAVQESVAPQAAGAPWAIEPPAAGQEDGPLHTEPEHGNVHPEQARTAEAPEAPAFETVTPEPAAEPAAVPGPAGEPDAEYAAAPEEPATDPAPGYDDAEREAVMRVMRERRDIRNGFRSDPIPHEVLLRVLEAAHTAPSVGHSQPWDFVVIRSAETRRSMHELAQRQRDAYAKSLPKGRAKQFREMKIEAILDTPVNIVVTADPTRGGRHTLGRHTQPQMAPYSSALAVENLWLAARAEGLGVGWVSFFDEREMVRALGLPEHLEIVAYLCVGYVDEFPEEPELMQAGWSKRRPLSWVVHEETYGRRALPGEEPHDLLQETIGNIRPLDAKALGEAWERQKRMTTPAGALGMLEIISAQLAGLSRTCPPPIPEPAAVAIFAGDHGVHAQGVTSWPQEVTGQMVANFLAGGAVCNAFASQVGAEVCVVDVGVATELPATPGLLPRKVRPGTADFTTGPAMSREDVLAAIEVGIETARDLVAAGNKGLLIGEMGIANTTASAALICVYTGADPSEVTGRGTGINDEMHARKVDVVRRALELHQPDPSDPIGVLAAVGGLEHAAMAGYLLGGASLRTPVILDGVSAGAAALVARAIAPEALAACIAGHRSAEPGHVAALNKLGLRPLIDLDLRLGEGTGALLALPIVQSAARAMNEVATFDSAGVTEK
ncbi:nicotinate-nucleotide--dimethylbenzimidazole phosphoribosyltransferase [Streptomyces sp. NBC_00102]|uniref:nicotinate-nucleotide--dimethylbenzimidazole phosphoribosyltransferase n=1 Tax=Streptomyces sp. NBC_00102 TaxID=2975652 RepID=UPI00224EEB16|nr:nicotinate-nucleotide--dimethylbenzimidazole phosphoribosyltransferase [Streptomyces sp. NBC_00102]MCX5395919.1 nicotinate-nucleotide--dimethylbenzimidazole phosphoribosyltransferase [Streptomyces sp. NBC_00102]